MPAEIPPLISYLPAPDEAIWVGVLRLSLSIPGARTLKDRRRVVLSLRDRIQARHHAAVAEVGHLDQPGAAVVAVTVVSNDPKLARSRLDTIRGDVLETSNALLDHHQTLVVNFTTLVHVG